MAAEEKPNLSALIALLASAPYTIQGQWYLNQSISLDGYRFIRCRFDNCSIFTSKGTFSLDHCFFTGCFFYVQDEARKAVRLASIVVPDIRQRWPYAAYKQESDGTVSIDA